MKHHKLADFRRVVAGSWTARNWQGIIALSFAAVILIQNFAPIIKTHTTPHDRIYYARTAACDIGCMIEKRTVEIYEERRPVNMERARLEALEEHKAELVRLVHNSPYVDYPTLVSLYGDQ